MKESTTRRARTATRALIATFCSIAFAGNVSGGADAPLYDRLGGQAVVEGVMMRGEGSYAVAVRTPEGKFCIKDLSKLGTTVNGTPLPRSLESAEAKGQDVGQWMDLPDKARIGLAGVIYLDFERTAGA